MSAVDETVRRRLPRRVYTSGLAGYHQLRTVARRNPGRGRLLPDFVIIGAAKAGTTSLYAWLCEHPAVARSRVKEIHYFSFYHYRGTDWYRQHFPLARDRAAFVAGQGYPFVTGEASPSYLMDADAPGRMAELIPDAKLIVLLRDPVARAYSQFQMRRRDGEEPAAEFLDAVALEDEAVDGGEARAQAETAVAAVGRTYLLRGRYAEQLRRWFAHFPREQFHIVATDDLAQDPQRELDRVHDFLSLPRRPAGPLEARFTSKYEPMPTEACERLIDYFAPHNERLYALLGRDFGWPR